MDDLSESENFNILIHFKIPIKEITCENRKINPYNISKISFAELMHLLNAW
jgi:hypothetical protein